LPPQNPGQKSEDNRFLLNGVSNYYWAHRVVQNSLLIALGMVPTIYDLPGYGEGPPKMT